LTKPSDGGYLREMPPANVARILREYGVALQTLDRSVGREEVLPCDKSLLRECLILAMAMARDEETKHALAEGYVLVEAFVSKRDYDAVYAFEESARDLRRARHDISPLGLHTMTREAADAHARAHAIQERVAAAMAKRERELAGGH